MRAAKIELGVLLSLFAMGASGCRFWNVLPLVDDVVRADATSDVAVDVATDAATDALVDASAEVADATAADPCEAHRAAMTAGVGAIDVRTYRFSPLAVHGARACPIMVTPSGRPFAAVAEEGSGRVVWLGHDALLQLVATQRDVAPLLRNSISWASRRALATARIGVSPETWTGTLPAFFAQEGLRPSTVSVRELRASGIDVWIVFSTTAPTAADEQQIVRDFVRSGGAVILAGQAWNWARSHPRSPVEAYPGNALVPSAGITALPEALNTGETTAGATVAVSALSHARGAVTALGAHARRSVLLTSAEQSTVWSVLRDATKATPIDATFWGDARRAVEGLPLAEASAARPLVPSAQPIDASIHSIVARINAHGPAPWIAAVPGGELFPGAIGAEPLASVTVSIDASAAPDDARLLYAQSDARVWMSTGVYAAPGRAITIRVASSAAGAELGVRIGAHDRDLTDEPTWARPPRVSREQRITSAETTTASVYGGLVYLTVAPGSNLGPIEVTIEGGARARSFVLATDRANESSWRDALRTSEVGWVEFVGDRVTLTVPIAAARAVSSPVALIEYWDAVARALDDFAGLTPTSRRRERVVFDPQVAGDASASSGYPAVRALSRASAALDVAALRSSGDWGGYFVLSRAVQSSDWLVAGAQDATVSVLSLYALERVTGIAHTAPPIAELASAARSARIDAYITGGRDFESDWSGFTALETYLQLREAFGWAPLRQCVREIAGLTMAERPMTTDARLQQWVARSSRAVGRDLSPFYTRWGWPVSASTRGQTASLPAWTESPARP
ncbi:MAG: hypothetical protein JNK05_07595 [Myxococcales bacterium]|nr:hypothetical protein [Myxococcales bacterium]